MGKNNLIFSDKYKNKFCELNSDLSEIYAFEIDDPNEGVYALVVSDFIIPFIINIIEFPSDKELLQLMVSEKLDFLWDSEETEESELEKTYIISTNRKFDDKLDIDLHKELKPLKEFNNLSKRNIELYFNPEKLSHKEKFKWKQVENILLLRSNYISLNDCLSFLSTETQLDESNKWKCPKCSKQVEAHKYHLIYNTPNVLIIHLSRFKCTDDIYEKDSRFIEFPDDLDVKQFVTVGDDCSYKLVGVVNHGGSMNGGHYTAHVKINDDWVKFNDQMFSKSREEDIHSSGAYILFYQKKK